VVRYYQKELNNAAKIKRGGGDRLFNYLGGLATLRGQQMKNSVALEMNRTVSCVCAPSGNNIIEL